jgi:murein DD-endopeptidase MepM/ murein hydrolase activator NlpD
VYDLGVQLEYVWYEITDGPAPYNKVLDKLRQTQTVEEATLLIELEYEVHAGGVQPERTSLARQFLTKYGSDGATAGVSSDSSTCSSGGEVVGGFSLPVDKKWYTQHKDWFTKGHHKNRDGSEYPAADIPVPKGTPVYSMTAGKIVKAPNGTATTSYGLGVTIEAPDGTMFYYGHGLDGGSVVGATEGKTVRAGQLIMHSGSTGNSTGYHVHVEIRTNGQERCPQSLFVGIMEGNIPNLESLPTSGCSADIRL